MHNEKEFIKGFNVGYTIIRASPEGIAEILEMGKNLDGDYARGLRLGKKQYDQEILLQRLEEQRTKSQTLKKGRTRSQPQPDALKCYTDECSGYDPILKVTYSGSCGKNTLVMQQMSNHRWELLPFRL